MYLYYFFAAISVWFAIKSLFSGVRYAKFVRRETSQSIADFQPFVSVIAPSRGLEPGLKENLSVLLQQDYLAYEVIFVLDRLEDPVAKIIEELRSCSPEVPTKIVIAGSSIDSGQKVHNLRVAVNDINENSKVLVFVDTDARPDHDWLRKLVAPLIDEQLGAATGYRWFVPLKGNFASRLRAVWNASIASALGEHGHKNFCWGGSTAIRKSTFDTLDVRQRWRGTVSDDFTITRILREAGLPIHFTPNCLVASVGDCDFKDLIQFTTRQVQITRVYSPNLWKPLLLGSLLFNLVFWGGILLLLTRLLLDYSVVGLSVTLSILFILGSAKSFIRWRVIGIPLRAYRAELRRDLAAHILFWPIASSLYLYNCIVAGFSRRISWRGITYELKSENEAVIISRA